MSANVRASLRLIDGLRFNVRTTSGHEIVLDSGPPPGGDAGPRPIELVLAALGGCGAMDVISILRKMRQDVTSYDVRVEGERRDEHPRVYTTITVTHQLEGRDLDEANVRRAVELSMSRYCPVYTMLSPAVPIDVRYEMIETDTREVTAGAVIIEEGVRAAV